MAAPNKALEIKANVTSGGKKVHPTGVRILNSINSTAQAAITYIHKSANAKNSATNLTSKEIFEAMGQRQTKSFKDTPDSPDVTINLKDGYNGSVSFKGNVSSPNYVFSVGDVALTEDVQPDYAAINCLDLSIYESMPSNFDAVVAKDYPSNIAELCKKVFEKLVENGENSINSIKDATKKAAYKKQHEINKKVQKFLTELLDNSKETIGWDDVLNGEQKPAIVMSIVPRVKETFRSKTGGGFLNNVLRLAEEFQCVYVPELDNIGKLVNKKILLSKNESLSVHPVSLSAHAGSVGMFPVRGVIVNQPDNSQSTTVASNSEAVKNASSGAAMYPKEPADGGTILPVLGPQWLPSTYYKTAELNPTTEGKKKKLQKNALPKDKAKDCKKINKSLKSRFENNEKIIEQWAETIYYWQALGQSYATLQTELNLKVQVGKRYKVKGDSGVLFSGILTAVDHSVDTNSKNCTAFSRLSFSHIIMGSASIPGIDG